MKRFAEIVEEVKNLSPDEKGELSEILDHILIDEKRKAIIKNHSLSVEELKSGKIKFHDKADDILTALNECA